MCKLEKIPYANHEEWLSLRRKLGIGGSEAATVIGANPYRSAYSLWLEKTEQLIPEDISDKEAVRLGNDLEQYVAQRWMEATGKMCRKCNFILKNPEIEYAYANPDRIVVGEKAGLECKTSSSFDTVDQCKRGFPEKYYCQCVHYLAVTGYDTWYLAVICFGRGFYTFELHREDVLDEITALLNAEKDFWDMVTTHTAPELDGTESTTDALKTIYADSQEGVIDLSPLAVSIAGYKAAKKAEAEAKEAVQKYQNEICDYMGSVDTGIYGTAKITWKTQTRKSFDSKRFEKEHPGVMAPYQTESTSRVFRFTEKKG